jgi:glycosyltransferase involved in cell wall biosynthesis
LRRYNHVWFCSPHEQAVFHHPRSSVLPNIPSSRPSVRRPLQPEGSRVLFVGSLWYEPNRDAMQWFLDHSWNAVRASVPSATLRIVGACSAEQQAAWARYPGVECPGFVHDLATEYSAARCAVAPIRFGGGTQIKVLEAYAHGRPCITSDFAYTGLSTWFRPGESILVSSTAEGMSAHCVNLLRSPEKAEHLAQAGACVIDTDLTWQAFRRHVALTAEHVRSLTLGPMTT